MLKRIEDHCKELLSLANAHWHERQEAERAATLDRVRELKKHIEEMMLIHNSAVMTVLQKRSPEEDRVTMSKLDTATRFAVSLQQFDVAAANLAATEDKPTKDVDRETMLATLPRELRLAHRFAEQAHRDAMGLMAEATVVHGLNKGDAGIHVERVPVRDGSSPEEAIIGIA